MTSKKLPSMKMPTIEEVLFFDVGAAEPKRTVSFEAVPQAYEGESRDDMLRKVKELR